MNKVVNTVLVVLFAIGTVSLSAEHWPKLEWYVNECVLIVKAKAVKETQNNCFVFEIVQTWKGEYNREDFENQPEEGFYESWNGIHGVDVELGQEIVFFFTLRNQPETGKIRSHSTAFPVVNEKIVYASTSFGERKEYFVWEFRRIINDIGKVKSPNQSLEVTQLADARSAPQL